MVVQIQRLEKKYETYKKLEKELNARQKEALEFIKETKRVSISDVEKSYPDYSRNTLKKRPCSSC